jgi:hypothetical protein
MPFTHPLARAAKAWAGPHRNQRTLVIITTLVLDPKGKRYRKALVEQLAIAAREYLAANPKDASGFILINRMRDWADQGV